MTKLEKEVFECLEPIINNIGYELYDVIYEKTGKNDNHLIIFIDKDGGIVIEDCEKVNNEISDILDKKDFIKEQYYLEVSSPGLERRIRLAKHFKNSFNSIVRINLYKPIDKEKELIGKLISFDEEKITISIENSNNKKNNDNDKDKNEAKEISIERKNISKITTYYDFSLSLGGDK